MVTPIAHVGGGRTPHSLWHQTVDWHGIRDGLKAGIVRVKVIAAIVGGKIPEGGPMHGAAFNGEHNSSQEWRSSPLQAGELDTNARPLPSARSQLIQTR